MNLYHSSLIRSAVVNEFMNIKLDNFDNKNNHDELGSLQKNGKVLMFLTPN